MFVLTTDLAGMEFQLDRASLVIGRTDENDIVLSHRSISRHHAKVVRDGDHYTIVDLQSANGVRVNGEDYERIELNPGDIVELGHVKLRFVGPFETFVFKPQSRGLTMPARIAIGAGAGLLGVIAVVAMLTRKHDPAEAPVAAAAPAPAPAPPAPPEPAAAAPPASDPAPAVSSAAIFAEAKQAAGAEDWEKSRATLDKLNGTIDDPALRRDATILRRRVDIERQGAVLFAQFDEASSAKNYSEAMLRYEQIPPDSIYKRRAKPRYDEARTLLVAEHMAAADKARTAGRCAEVKTEVAEVVRLDPRNTIAKEMIRLCRPRLEPAPRPVAARPGGGGATGEAAPEPDVHGDRSAGAARRGAQGRARRRGRARCGRVDEAGARGVAPPAVRIGGRSVPQGAARQAGHDRRLPDHRGLFMHAQGRGRRRPRLREARRQEPQPRPRALPEERRHGRRIAARVARAAGRGATSC